MAGNSTSAGTSGLLDVGMKVPTLAWQVGTLGQPLIGAAYVAAALGYLGYKTGPWFTKKFARLTSPFLSAEERKELNTPTEKKPAEDVKKERKTWAGVLAALGALGVIGLNYRPNAPDKGLFSYAPMHVPPKESPPAANTTVSQPAAGIPKNDNFPMPQGTLPLGQCVDMINSNPNLEPYMKGQALTLLDSFNAPPMQPINGGNLIGQAIVTGQSAATGLAVGWLTAKALGLPNPKSTAILGAVANTLGPWSAVATSLALGH